MSVRLDEHTVLLTESVNAYGRAVHAAMVEAIEAADDRNKYDDMAWIIIRALADRGYVIVKQEDAPK